MLDETIVGLMNIRFDAGFCCRGSGIEVSHLMSHPHGSMVVCHTECDTAIPRAARE